MLAFCASHRRALVVIVALICGGVLLSSIHNNLVEGSEFRDRLALLLHGPIDVTTARENQMLLPHVEEERLHWGDKPVPPTQIIAHAPGWTIFDRLYVKGGVIYIVTDYPELVPPYNEITSKGIEVGDGGNNIKEMEPTDAHIQTISTRQATELFGSSAIEFGGVTMVVNECSQYMNHYYHFVAELLFGLWRTYSSLDQRIEPNGHTILPAPRRLIFPHLTTHQWRDYAAMNQFVLRAAFPSLLLEFSDAWNERAAIKNQVVTYDRVVFSDRAAAMHGSLYTSTKRIAAEAAKLKTGPNWWSTIRMAVLEFSKVRKSDVMGRSSPVITYVSRQKWGRRMLKEEDHNRLVAGLEALRDRKGIEVHIVELDKLSRPDQIRLAARTTIMMGIHGNGLTQLLWMKPTAKTAVIEFFFPGGFAQDYQWTAEAIGIRHFGVWNNHIFTAPNLPPLAYPEGFQGNHIPLDAATVMDLVERQLNMEEVLDDE